MNFVFTKEFLRVVFGTLHDVPKNINDKQVVKNVNSY